MAEESENEKIALTAMSRFDDQLAKLDDAEEKLHAAIEDVHAATKGLAQMIREARDAVKSLSRDEVRKYLAKESQAIADQLRVEMKRAKKG